ncbi:hypothetical protein KLP28_04410 [Nocardioidaceae bacterium]|nr:hypothetical protein KLP28_04410 [Nocardioidaceae bacterium]
MRSPSASRPALLEAALDIAGCVEEAQLWDVLVDHAATLLDADAAVLGRFGLGGRVFDLMAGSGLPAGEAADAAVERARRAYASLSRHEAPTCLVAGTGRRAAAGKAWALHPIHVGGDVVARLHLMRGADRPFVDADVVDLDVLVRAAEVRVDQVRREDGRQRRLRALEATASIAEVLAPPTRVDEGLAHVAQAAVRMIGASAVAVLQESGHGRPDILAVAGPAARTVPDLLFRVDPQVLAATAETDVVLVPDGRDRLMVLVPLNAHLSFSGVLMCLLERSDGLRSDETEALGSFADQTALALDRAQAVADRQELMLISDRDRIARDLHDVVIQRLFATGLRLKGLGRHLTDELSGTRLHEAITDLDLTITDIRGTIFDLKQAPGSQARDTVRGIVREYIPLLGFTPVVRTSGPVDTVAHGEVLDQVSAVLRECLSNVMRHAAAGSVVVELEATGRGVVLRVTDDGVGLPATVDRRSGLANMTARARALGGGSRAYDGEPGGTVVEWWVPVDGGEPPRDAAAEVGAAEH